jgi:hypothetical protein
VFLGHATKARATGKTARRAKGTMIVAVCGDG